MSEDFDIRTFEVETFPGKTASDTLSATFREIALIMNRVLILTSVNYDQSVQPESV